MVDEKDMSTVSDEESNVDQINQFVASSDNTIEEKHTIEGVVDNPKEEKISEEESEKKEQKTATTKKADKKEYPKKEEMNTNNKKENTNKKPEPKPEQKKIIHKASVAIKNILPKRQKQEKKIMKTNPTPKKTTKPAKESSHKENRDKSKKHFKSTLLWIGIGILAAILVISIILVISPKQQSTSDKFNIFNIFSGKNKQDTINQTNNSVAATVNGEAIYLQDITQQYNNLNPLYQQMYTIESLLNKSIDDLLLYQEAKNSGIKIDPNIIQNELDSVMIQNEMTVTELEQALEKQGMTIDDAKKLIEKNLMIRELLNNTILQNITITDTEIQNYYELNMEQFAVPEQVTIQHILVMPSQNMSDAEAKAKIEGIRSELTTDNFCELASKYSEDPGSKDNCGEYTFAKGDFNNPAFENPSFDLDIGETAIINTTFGYHLIKKVAKIPSSTMSLTEVYDNINGTLYDEAAQKKFDTMLEGLRTKATIINYYTKVDVENTTIIPQKKNLDNFAKCLTEKNATFYGAYWCGHCNNQKTAFGDSLQYVKYVECAVEGQPQVQTAVCTEAGISGYPTWIINGKEYPGEQTLERLAQLTGCALS
ncbi:MAG: peptidylprolyl isomerase [Candidatus Woesearchaeota archaeon]